MANTDTPAPGYGPDPVSTIQEVLKCKWVLLILSAIQDGHYRPSSIERSIDGLSHKVLHQRLDKLTRLQVVERIERAAKTQQVEYRMTTFGAAIGKLVRDIQSLRTDTAKGPQAPPTPSLSTASTTAPP